mmetsp:Transcript_56687/g.123427  ORF Transcript_56687/g.123427 Transcript_56687/m.123427 type:complete len:376 (-) Transcript_56687:1729-2856(-)
MRWPRRTYCESSGPSPPSPPFSHPSRSFTPSPAEASWPASLAMTSVRTFQSLLASAVRTAASALSSTAPLASSVRMGRGLPVLGPFSSLRPARSTGSAAGAGCQWAHTSDVRSETQMKAPARASSDSTRARGTASSSQGTEQVIARPSWAAAVRWTPFRALGGRSDQMRSSKPPLSTMSSTRASPAGPRTLECSLAAERTSSGSTMARRKSPELWRPNAESQRRSSLRFAARHLGPSTSLSFLSWTTSWPRRSWMRFRSGHAASSSGTLPWMMLEDSASTAACCGEAAELEPPASSVLSRSTASASKLSSLPAWPPRRSATNSSGESASLRGSDNSSSKTPMAARKTFGILSRAVSTTICATAVTTSAGVPAISL